MSIEVSAAKSQLALGTGQQYSATALLSDGSKQDVTNDASWSSTQATVATVSTTSPSKGLASSVALGSTTITATYSSVSGGMALTVTSATLTAIGITPAAPTVAKGSAKQFTATGTFTDGTTQDISSGVTWSSSDNTTATVSNVGLAQTLKQGGVTVTAAKSGITANTTLTVTAAVLSRIDVTPANPSVPNGLDKQFSATGVYTDGTTQDLTTSATWTSSSTSIATVVATGTTAGLAHTLAQGTTTISAASSGITGTTTLTVTAATLTSIAVTPASPSVANGLTKQFTATGTYTDGTTQNITATVIWSSSAPAVATISNATASAGLAQSLTQGTSTISAAQTGVSGATTLTVTAATLARIDVTPASPSVPKGLTQQFTATAVFTDGTNSDLTTTVTWASSAPAVAPVSNASGSKGLTAASTIGTATISASSQGVTGSATLTVTAANLISIQVTPTNPSLPVGFSRPFVATGRYSDSTTQDITQQVTWASTNTAVATVNNTTGNQGVATGVAAGSTTVTAQQGSVIGQTSLTVTSATLSSIQVTPSTASIAKGAKQPFVATGAFSDSTTLDISTQVTWSSSDPSIASISNAAGSKGLASSVVEGSVVISAAVSGSSVSPGTANLTVSPKALVSISVSPVANSVAKGSSLQFTATGTYSDTSSGDITSVVTWSSSNTSLVTIDNAATPGLAKGVATGQVTITAQQGSVNGSTTLTVSPAVLSSIGINPATATVPKGLKQQYTATGLYTDGTQQDLTQTVTWTSDAPTIAAISNASGSVGLATTLAVGVASITATSGGVSSSAANLTVTTVGLVSITLSPANASLPNGKTQQYSATGNYSDGSSVDLTSQVTWLSSKTNIADIGNATGNQGLAIAKAVGSTTITATEPTSGVSGSTALTVTTAQLVGISVTAVPAVTSIAAGYSAQYIATGQYSDGSQQDVTTSASWISFNPQIAAVGDTASTKGFVQGVAAGSTSISASVNGVSGTATVSVSNATLVSIAVTPANATIHPNGTLQYASVGTFSDGSTLNLTQQVTWASSNTLAATISNAAGSKGLATAGGLIGSTTISAATHGVTGSTQLTRALN